VANPKFYVGLPNPAHATHFTHAMISINRLITRARDGTYARRRDGLLKIRRKPIEGSIFLDSGAFTILSDYKDYPETVEDFCEAVLHIASLCNVEAVSSQDFLCDPHFVALTGLSVIEHQRRTIERYDAIRAILPSEITVVPVLQGYEPCEYLEHLAAYGSRLAPGMRVGIGSLCNRSSKPKLIEQILVPIFDARPDLRYHGYALKTRSLRSSIIQSILSSADSMSWSYAARREKRNQNDWREAEAFRKRIQTQPAQLRSYQYEMAF
jgi:hypothetical protein